MNVTTRTRSTNIVCLLPARPSPTDKLTVKFLSTTVRRQSKHTKQGTSALPSSSSHHTHQKQQQTQLLVFDKESSGRITVSPWIHSSPCDLQQHRTAATRSTNDRPKSHSFIPFHPFFFPSFQLSLQSINHVQDPTVEIPSRLL
mmetsp:Transcript_27141/g.64921  ORF Transcript_27141/g.64921 Transcript_27141/m.64921 type:complete len:144 (+) Transcript_27141:6-437(+)